MNEDRLLCWSDKHDGGWDADFIFNPKSTQRSNQPLEINDVDDLDLEFEDDDRGGPLQAGGTGSHRASPLPPQTNKSLARTEGSKKNTSLQPQVSSLSESMEEGFDVNESSGDNSNGDSGKDEDKCVDDGDGANKGGVHNHNNNNVEEEENEDWDVEFGVTDNHSSSQTGSTHSPVALNIEELFGDNGQPKEGEYDSLLEFLDKPVEANFNNAFMYYSSRDLPKAPKLFSTLRVKSSHRSSSTGKKTGLLNTTMNSTTSSLGTTSTLPSVSSPSISPVPPSLVVQAPETFQATFTWIQEMAKDVIAQAQRIKDNLNSTKSSPKPVQSPLSPISARKKVRSPVRSKQEEHIAINLNGVTAVEQIEKAVEACEMCFREGKRMEGLEGILHIFESYAKEGSGLRSHGQDALLDNLAKLLHYLAKVESRFSDGPSADQDEAFCITVRCLRIACDLIRLIDKDQHFYRRTPITRCLISTLVHLLLVNETRWAPVFSETLLESSFMGIWKQCRNLQYQHDQRKVKPIVEKGSEDRNLELQASIAADALLMALGYSPVTLRWFRVIGLGQSDESDEDSYLMSPTNDEIPASAQSPVAVGKLMTIHENLDSIQDFLGGLLDHEDFDLNFDSKDMYYGGDKFRFVEKSERLWPVPILFALIPHLPKTGSTIIRAKSALALGMYFFNLEHGELQTYDPFSTNQPNPTSTAAPMSSSTDPSTNDLEELNGSDNYGVDIMGAAESLTFEAVFLLRQNKEHEYLTFSPRIAVGWKSTPPLCSPDSTSELPVTPTTKDCSLYFTSLGYTALKAFGDVLIRCNKHHFAIEIFEICIIILDSKGMEDECRRLRRDLALTCARNKDRERAVKHSYYILSDARNRENTTEVVFLTDLLASLHLDNGDFTLAQNVIRDNLVLLEEIQGRNKSRISFPSRLAVERLHLRLAHVYLSSGEYSSAVTTLSRLLDLIDSRGGDTSAQAGKRVVVLAWIAKAYLKQRNFHRCMATLDKIVETRSKMTLKFVDNRKHASRRTPSGTLSAVNYVTTSGVGAGLWQWCPASSSTGNLESCLPSFCSSEYNEDLGELMARNLMHARQYVRALQCITPTLCSVETAVGGLNGANDGLIEMGRLYYLRGKIQQLGASAKGAIHYPFQVSCVPRRLYELSTAGLSCSNNSSNNKSPTSPGGGYRSDEEAMPQAGEKPSPGGGRKVRSMRVSSYGSHILSVSESSRTSHRHSRRYTSSEELFWDAARWYRRAWECYKTAGDLVHAAKAATALAKIHLQTVFCSVAVFKVPYDVTSADRISLTRLESVKIDYASRDVMGGDNTTSTAPSKESNKTGGSPRRIKPIDEKDRKESGTWRGLTVDTALNSGRPRRNSDMGERRKSSSPLPRGLDVPPVNKADKAVTSPVAQRACLEDAEPAARYGLDIAVESCMPFLMLEAYLNMAELRMLQGDNFQAIAFWWEARDLFLGIFVDGPAMPLSRRAPIGVLEKALGIVRRMVRFLATLERPLINQNLLILDLYTLLQFEMDRAVTQSSQTPRPLSFGSVASPGSSMSGSNSSSGNSASRSCASPTSLTSLSLPEATVLDPLFVYPQSRRRRDSSLRRAAQKQRGPFKLELVHSPVNAWGGRRRSDGEFMWWTRSLMRNTISDLRVNEQADEDIKTKTLPSRLSVRSSSAVEDLFKGVEVDEATCGLVPKDNVEMPMSKRTLEMAEHLTSVASGLFVQDKKSLLKGPAAKEKDLSSYATGTDSNLIQRLWQCLYMIRRQAGTYSLGQQTLTDLRSANRRALKQIAVHMKSLRGRTMQSMAAEFTYDELLSRAESLEKDKEDHGSPRLTGQILMSERLRRVIYVLQIDDMIFTYSPHTGYRHMQHIGTAASAPQVGQEGTVMERKRSVSVPQLSPSKPADVPMIAEHPLLSTDMKALLHDLVMEPREKNVGGGSAQRYRTLSAFMLRTGADEVSMYNAPEEKGSPSYNSNHVSAREFFAKLMATIERQEQKTSNTNPAVAMGERVANKQEPEKTVTFSSSAPASGSYLGKDKPSSSGRRGTSMSSFLSIFRSMDRGSQDGSNSASSPATPQDSQASPCSRECSSASDGWEASSTAPVSIICTKYLHFLPWEYALGSDVNITRYLSLHAVVNIPSDQLQTKTTPSSVPQLFGYFHRGREHDVRAKQSHIGSGAVQRVLWELGQIDTVVGTGGSTEVWPRVDSTVANSSSSSTSNSLDTATRGPEGRYLRRVPHVVSEDLHADLWPLTTPPLPLGTVPGGLTSKLTRKRHITFFDATQAGTNLFSVLSWLDNYSGSSNNGNHHDPTTEIPVFMLSYADLARFCESVLCLLTSRPDCVLLFVPPASADLVIREICAKRDAVLALKRDKRKNPSGGDKKAVGVVDEGARGGNGNENCRHRGSIFTGDNSYQVLVSAVHAIRSKHHIPVVLFNL